MLIATLVSFYLCVIGTIFFFHFWFLNTHAQLLNTLDYLKKLNNKRDEESCPITDAASRGEPKAKKLIKNQIEHLARASVQIAPYQPPMLESIRVEQINGSSLDDRAPLLEYQLYEPKEDEPIIRKSTKVEVNNNEMQ